MTVIAPSMPLLVKVPMLRPAVETTRPLSSAADDDHEARRLAAAISRGDEAAFRRFYDRYQPRLIRLGLVLARGDEALAQDAVQAAFVIAAQKLRRAESAEHLWNWLACVTRQQLVKSWRRRTREANVIGVAEVPDCAAAGQSDGVLEECLDTALRSLAEDEREVIEWFYFDGLSHKEIAERLNATPKAASSRLERARTKLRSAIAQKLFHEI